MSNFIPPDRRTDYLLPPSLDDCLTQDHLARFVVEVIDGLDLSNLTRQYAGRGSKAHHPATLLAILVYGYCTDAFSSRQLEMPTEMKLLKLGTVCLDGTKIHANASRHSALSHGHIVKLEAQLKREVQELLALAEAADTANNPDGMSLPKELKLREDRLAAMAAAKAKIAERAAARYVREKAEFDEKINKRETQEKDTGKKPRGKPPTPPEPGAKDSDQINLTHEESRIMKVSGGGFDQCYNAQAGVAAQTMQAMAHRLTTQSGKAAYALRKQTVEPVFGIIQSVMGFRQFSLRGLRKATGEWNLVCLAWNVKRMAVLRPKFG